MHANVYIDGIVAKHVHRVQAGREIGRKGKQVCRQAGSEAGRLIGGETGRQEERYAKR